MVVVVVAKIEIGKNDKKAALLVVLLYAEKCTNVALLLTICNLLVAWMLLGDLVTGDSAVHCK